MPKELIPYLVPLLVVALIIRRSGRSRRVNLARMWVAPAIFALMTFGALAAEPLPSLAVVTAFAASALAGGGLGYLRALHQELSIDPQTGTISSKATAIGTLLVLGLFVLRFGLKLAFPQLQAHGHAGAQVAAAANGLLIFTVTMLVVQSVLIWSRAQPLLAAHAERSMSSRE